MFDAFEGLTKERNSAYPGHCFLAGTDLTQCLTIHKLHDHEKIITLPKKSIYHDNIRMIKKRQYLSFFAKAFDQIRPTGIFRMYQLDGDFTLQHQIDALEDFSHAAFANDLQYLIVTNDLIMHSWC